MDRKICVVCNTEKSIDNFYNKYRECKQCNIQRSMKRYYENKDELSNQRKKYYERKRDVLLARLKYVNKTENLIHNNKIEELTQALETIILKK